MFRPTPPALSLQVKMVRRWGMRANASDLEIELTEAEKPLVSQIDFNFSATSHEANSWRPIMPWRRLCARCSIGTRYPNPEGDSSGIQRTSSADGACLDRKSTRLNSSHRCI